MRKPSCRPSTQTILLEPPQLLFGRMQVWKTATSWPYEVIEMSSRLKVTTRVHCQHSFDKAATVFPDHSYSQMPASRLVSMTNSQLNCFPT